VEGVVDALVGGGLYPAVAVADFADLSYFPACVVGDPEAVEFA